MSSVEMIPYVFNEQKGLWSLLQSDDKLLGHLFRSFRVQIGELISLYLSLKNDYDSLGEFVNSLSKRYLAMCQILQIKPKLLPASGDIVPLSGQLPFWLTEYYSSVNELFNEPDSLSAGFAFGFAVLGFQHEVAFGLEGLLAGNSVNFGGVDVGTIYSGVVFANGVANVFALIVGVCRPGSQPLEIVLEDYLGVHRHSAADCDSRE